MNLPIKLNSIPRSKLLILFLVVFVVLILLFGGIYYWLGYKKEVSLSGGAEEYIVVRKITSYASPGGEVDGYFKPGIKFTILKEENGWLYIRATLGGEGWIQDSEAVYKPVGE